jgi:hypothetical protein
MDLSHTPVRVVAEACTAPDGDAPAAEPKMLDEGVDVWRPVEAEPLGDGIFRVLSPRPDSERLALDVEPDQTVCCERRTLSGCTCWVVVERIG